MDKIQDFQANSPRWLSLEDFEGEVWKQMNGFENQYEVSNMGRVKALSRDYMRIGRNGVLYSATRKAHIMFSRDNGHGYLVVCMDGRKHIKRYIHRLVAEYFIPNPKKKPYVDHINTNRADNRMVNLRWVTASENALNPISLERNRIAQGIPVVLLDCWGEYQGEFFGAQELANFLGIERSVVNDAITQKRACRFANGFIVIRKEDYDINNNYVKTYKRGTSKFTFIPNDKMVLAFRGRKLYTVFQNTQIAADFYNICISAISKRCRENGRGEVHKYRGGRVSDELYYYKDVTQKHKDMALRMLKDKYSSQIFNG